jgi:hypothetical protein
LSELLWAYLWWLSWWSDEDYAALYGEDNLIPDEITNIESSEEIENNIENTETTIEALEPEVTPETAENE